jgi:hypothetical protein
MALINAGTLVQLPTSRVPLDFTAVAVSSFTDFEYESTTRTLSILKSTVQDADPCDYTSGNNIKRNHWNQQASF